MNQTPDKPGPKAGGAIIAILTLVGAFTGNALGQPSIGVLAGFGLGCAIATAIWWKDRAN